MSETCSKCLNTFPIGNGIHGVYVWHRKNQLFLCNDGGCFEFYIEYVISIRDMAMDTFLFRPETERNIEDRNSDKA